MRCCHTTHSLLFRVFRESPGGSAAVCDPNPPRPFARSIEKFPTKKGCIGKRLRSRSLAQWLEDFQSQQEAQGVTNYLQSGQSHTSDRALPPGTKPIHAGKNSRGINFCANTLTTHTPLIKGAEAHPLN